MIRWEDGTGWCFIESLCWTGWSSELWDGLYTAACPGSVGWKTENTVSRYPRITLLLASIIISITSSYTMNKNRICIHSEMYQVLIFAVSVKVNVKFYFCNVTYSTIQKGSARFAFSLVSYGAFPLHGTVRYGSLLGGFPLSTVPGTWYFFSTTSAEVPSEPYRYQNVTCKLCWSLIGLGKSSLLRHWTCHTRPSSTALPTRFKSAQPAKADLTKAAFIW